VSEESQVSEQIQQLEDARFAAMVGKDVATPDRLLDDKHDLHALDRHFGYQIELPGRLANGCVGLPKRGSRGPANSGRWGCRAGVLQDVDSPDLTGRSQSVRQSRTGRLGAQGRWLAPACGAVWRDSQRELKVPKTHAQPG
jgi:hypothetical protein